MITDKTPMPFGTHKGKPMKKVPASYLNWLWFDGVKDEEHNPVHQYIRDNMAALKGEDDDLIWE